MWRRNVTYQRYAAKAHHHLSQQGRHHTAAAAEDAWVIEAISREKSQHDDDGNDSYGGNDGDGDNNTNDVSNNNNDSDDVSNNNNDSDDDSDDDNGDGFISNTSAPSNIWLHKASSTSLSSDFFYLSTNNMMFWGLKGPTVYGQTLYSEKRPQLSRGGGSGNIGQLVTRRFKFESSSVWKCGKIH